jgi:RND family efflux transporter MFP subunit
MPPKFLVSLGFVLAWSCATDAVAEDLRVTASPLAEITISTEGRAPATVMATNHSVIAAQIRGVVASVEVEVAREVAKGQLLVLIDPRDFELNVERGQAALKAQDARIDQARKRLARARDLNDRNFTSVDDLHARETDLSVFQADREALVVALAQAERELAKTRVVAPFAGSVFQRDAQVGAYVSPGMPLLTLVQTDQAELEGEITPVEADSLSSSTNIVFSSNGREWPVELVRLSSVIGERSRVQKVRLRFGDSAPAIGSSGYLVWQRGQQALPADLVVKRGSELGVFTVDRQTARFVPLPNAQEGRPALVTLPANTLIVVGGRDQVEDGDPVITEG